MSDVGCYTEMGESYNYYYYLYYYYYLCIDSIQCEVECGDGVIPLKGTDNNCMCICPEDNAICQGEYLLS